MDRNFQGLTSRPAARRLKVSGKCGFEVPRVRKEEREEIFFFVSFFSFLLRGLTVSYLVDPASSHMLVSKIKPCMSKYKQLCTVKLRMAH